MITLSSSLSVVVYEDFRQVHEKAPSSTCVSYNEHNTCQELNDDTSLSTVIPEWSAIRKLTDGPTRGWIASELPVWDLHAAGDRPLAVTGHRISWKSSKRRGRITSAQLHDAKKMLRLRSAHFPGSGKALGRRSNKCTSALGRSGLDPVLGEPILCTRGHHWGRGSRQTKKNVMNKAIGHDFPLCGHRTRPIVMHT
jgi:hypothetical protein